MRSLLVSFAFLLFPLAAQSDPDSMARLKAASQAAQANISAFYVSRIPELEGVMPEPEWTDEVRNMQMCLLDGLAAKLGDTEVEAYVAAMEAFSIVSITSLSQLGTLMPPALMSPEVNDLNVSCGIFAYSQRATDNPKMLEIISKPENIAKLTAEQ